MDLPQELLFVAINLSPEPLQNLCLRLKEPFPACRWCRGSQNPRGLWRSAHKWCVLYLGDDMVAKTMVCPVLIGPRFTSLAGAGFFAHHFARLDSPGHARGRGTF